MRPLVSFSKASLFLALMCVAAYIQITLPTPWFSMHLTLQIMVSILSGFVLTPRYAFLSLSVYLLMGLAGLPVFAQGGGIGYLFRPTFGFVLGFLACSVIVSWLWSKRKPRWLCGLSGLFVFYLLGMTYYYFSFPLFLGTVLPWQLALWNSFLVSIVPDLILCWIACQAAKRLNV